MMYIRFVVGTEKEKTNTLHGPITELRLLRDEGSLYEYEIAQANEIFGWFNDELPCPPFAESKWPDTAISWFKLNEEAKLFIQKMYDIKSLLHEHGIQVRVIKTDDPGMKLYEDNFQVIATSSKGRY